MKKCISIVFMVFLAIQMLPAQINITGKVYDNNSGLGLKGASIQLDNSFVSYASGQDGSFSFLKLSKGKHIIKVRFLGFASQQLELNLKQDTSILIGMQKSAYLSEEVVISATHAGEKTPITVQNIDKKQVQELNYGQDIPVMLQGLTSAVVTSDAGSGIGYTGLRIRGNDITRINVTINGLPLNDPESHSVFFVNMPDFASSIDNIQVQRGVGTSASGVASFGAAINIQTLKCIPKPYAEVNLGYGSFNTQKYNLNFGTGLLQDHWTIDGRLSKIWSDGYIDRAFSDLKSFYLSAGYYGSKSLLKINLFSGKERTYQAWYGVPQACLDTHRTYNPYTYENQTDNYQQDHFQILWSKELFRTTTLNLAGFYVHGAGYYEEYEENQLFADYGLQNLIIATDTLTQTNLIRQRWLDNDFYGCTFNVNYQSSPRFNCILGGGWNQYHGGHFGKIVWAEFASNSSNNANYYQNTGVKTDFNTYLKATYAPWTRLTLYGDIQYRRISYDFVGFDNDFLNVSQSISLQFINPKFGLSYDMSEKNQIYLSYGISHKEPNRDDFVSSTPNTRPKAEQLQNLELGVKHRSRHGHVEGNLFYMKYQDQLCLTGKLNDVGAPIRINVPQSYRLGVELSGDASLSEKIQLFANAALSDNKIETFTEYIDNYDTQTQMAIIHKNSDLSFSPSLIGYGGFSLTPLPNFRFQLSGKYVGKQYLDNTSQSDRALRDYTTIDLKLSYLLHTKLLKEIEISLLLNNLFSQQYISSGWTYSSYSSGLLHTENGYFPQAGLNFISSVRIKL